MSGPAACLGCLRRAWLLRALAPYIERVTTGEPGSRSPELLRLDDEPLALAVAPNDAARLLAERAELRESRLRDELARAGAWACCQHGDLYPDSLADAPDAPRALFGLGARVHLARFERSGAVTVVGARRASEYGRRVARELARDLAACGLLVISGMAYGVDGAAHRGALEAGRTIAVLGTGVDLAYPAAHRGLHRRVCERGLVLSEMPPGSTAWKWTFPARNRIMAALAQMTVVVEAARRSGSLITAQQAADLGRDVGAVPGPVTSASSSGSNGLLAAGAHVIREAQDVLDVILGPGIRSASRTGPALDPTLLAALEAIERGNGSCDSVAAVLGLAGSEAGAALARLELLGYLERSELGSYSRTLLAPPPGTPGELAS
jgi:DNA processing protein